MRGAARNAEERGDIAVVILAGGEATRLPGKLLLASDGEPLIARVFRQLSPGRETVIAGRGGFPAPVDARLTAPLVIDRRPSRGPLGGLLTAMSYLPARRVFASAGDMPYAAARLIDELDAAWRDGDEAVVPEHGPAGRRRREPLAALYDRAAFLREGMPLFARGGGALHDVCARLRTRYVPFADARQFVNVNTAEEYAAWQSGREGESP